MPPVTKTVSPHDLIWVNVQTHSDWQVMIIGDDNTYTIPRVIRADFLKCLRITQRQYSNFWDNERLDYFEWRGYILPKDYKLEIVIIGNRILGVQPIKQKVVKDIKAKKESKSKVIVFPKLWRWKNWFGVSVVAALLIIIFVPHILSFIVNQFLP